MSDDSPRRVDIDGDPTDAVRGTRYHVVDVFTRGDDRYTGNQLGVFHDTADLSTADCLAITRETNFSECTFVDGRAAGGFDVRIFDPVEEIPFAGHPTLGTAAIVRELVEHAGAAGAGEDVTLNLGVGPIDVWVERPDGDATAAGEAAEEHWMRQIPPEFGETVPADAIAPALGLDTDAVADAYPVQSVSTGLPTLVVPLASVAAVERASTTRPAYDQVLDTYGEHNLLVVARGGVDGGDLHARVFADYAGVPEDPATGSAAGCLAGWLLEHEFLGDGPVAATVEQGYEMGRPSRLRLRAHRGEDGDPVVEVGGRVVPVAKGRLL